MNTRRRTHLQIFCTIGPGCGRGCNKLYSPIPCCLALFKARLKLGLRPSLLTHWYGFLPVILKRRLTLRVHGCSLWLGVHYTHACLRFVHRSMWGCSHSAFSTPPHPWLVHQNPSHFPSLFQNRNFQKEPFSLSKIFFFSSKSWPLIFRWHGTQLQTNTYLTAGKNWEMKSLQNLLSRGIFQIKSWIFFFFF